MTEEAWTRMPSDSIKPGYPASNTVSGLLVAYMRHFSASIWGHGICRQLESQLMSLTRQLLETPKLAGACFEYRAVFWNRATRNMGLTPKREDKRVTGIYYVLTSSPQLLAWSSQGAPVAPGTNTSFLLCFRCYTS